MEKVSIKEIPVYYWSKEIRLELEKLIRQNTLQKYTIIKDIVTILATGTRSYKLENKTRVFNSETSDLDVIVQVTVDTYKQLIKSLTCDCKYPVDNPLLTPRVVFSFRGIKISCFIMPSDYDFLNYFGIQTMAVDLANNKILGQFNIDLFNYLVKKGRLDSNQLCYVCNKFIADNGYLITYNIYKKDGEHIYDGLISLCPTCYTKYIKNNNLTDTIRRC